MSPSFDGSDERAVVSQATMAVVVAKDPDEAIDMDVKCPISEIGIFHNFLHLDDRRSGSFRHYEGSFTCPFIGDEMHNTIFIMERDEKFGIETED